MSADPHRHFWKVIWNPRKISIVSEIALNRGMLYQGSNVLSKKTMFMQGLEH